MTIKKDINDDNSKSQLFPDEDYKPNPIFESNTDFNYHTAPLFINDNDEEITKQKYKTETILPEPNQKNLIIKNKYDKNSQDNNIIDLTNPKNNDNYLCDDYKNDNFLCSENQTKTQTNWDLEISEENKEKPTEKLEWAISEPLKSVHDDYDEISPKAMKFPFELDNFQKQAIVHLQKGESVFVSAHTSAGKTVIAEYAIALSLTNLTRAIYTSPIKTLSNQKFRDFKKAFGNVGIITGDVSINPDASCLVLTTEIFRSILYKGSEIVRDIEWVIFDEVHYINDYDRGVVWEEVIIMLPEHINIILLSATVPNSLEFANWVGLTKNKRIFVLSTQKRPVPLNHFIWKDKRLFNVINNDQLINKSFTEMKAHCKKMRNEVNVFKGGFYSQNKAKYFSLVDMLKKKSLMPAVVFVFSKKKCNTFAEIISRYSFNNKTEIGKISLIMHQALKRLSGNDKKLPQIMSIWRLLEKGIGIHHAGLLPLVKEVVEMCFARALVKILFATETFAMGVNMPARTVVFDNYKKHDGYSFRFLKPGEYVQMSGRAGRRGLDTFGTVIIMGSDKMNGELKDLKSLLTESPERLQSKFKVTYNMILNLFKSEDREVEEVIKKSFDQFRSQSNQPDYILSLKENEEKLSLFRKEKNNEISQEVEDYIQLYVNICGTLTSLINRLILHNNALNLLKPGKVILIKNDKTIQAAIAVILKVIITDEKKTLDESIKFISLIFIPSDWPIEKEIKLDNRYNIFSEFELNNGFPQKFIIDAVYPKDILCLTDQKAKIKNRVSQIMLEHNSEEIKRTFMKISSKLDDNWRHDYVKMFLEKFDVPFEKLEIEISQSLENLDQMAGYDFHQNYEFIDQFYSSITSKLTIRKEVDKLNYLMSDESNHLIEIFQRKIKVLQQLGHINKDRSVLIKGIVACEVNNCQSLILTELIFRNILKNLSPEDILSILSCLIFTHYDSDKYPTLNQTQQIALNELILITEHIGSLQEKFKIDMSAEKFVATNINIGLMEVVYRWSKGEDFKDICGLTDIPEGSIVRNIMRLDETCRDIKNAARVIGDPELFRKMETASSLIKRDIVFTASLYLM